MNLNQLQADALPRNGQGRGGVLVVNKDAIRKLIAVVRAAEGAAALTYRARALDNLRDALAAMEAE